jgi:glycosyltransferase involved in cell wall biosynthesis
LKKFVIVVPSYQNSKWLKRNLFSILNQQYDSYRVIYTDDASPDGTGSLVEEYCATHDLTRKITVVKNPERKGALENLYRMIHSCNDDEVCVLLDGDDHLAGTNVLSTLNTVYESGDVWMTYGSYMDHPQNSRGCCLPYTDAVINSNNFRTDRWRASHLRTMRADLFKKIRVEDLKDQNGNFFEAAWDLAIMLPLLEMSGHHHRYVHDILYIYNNENPIQDYKVKLNLQQTLERFIRSKVKYSRIESL